MPCYSPLQGFRALEKNASGKRSIVFSAPYIGAPVVELSCGQCIGCRLERSRQWAIRCVHEASMHEDNCFVTLTYRDEDLPSNGSLRLKDYQKFMKRLRKEIEPQKVRFFHCGEYGDMNKRPHYHACLFGFDFNDKILWKERDGVRLYTSEILEELWPFGFCTIGDVTFESAAYVARYITKKITGKKADEHYKGLKPEYTTMSRRPGIGSGWFDKFSTDVYPSDEVVLRGKILTPPKYYDRCFEKQDLEAYEAIKIRRKARALARASDNTPERLAVKEVCKKAQFNQLKRGFENG